MKKSIISTLFILISLSMYSQIHKNTWEVFVDGQYGKTFNHFGTSSNDFSIEKIFLGAGTSLGYHFTENFMIGLGLDYNHQNENTINYLTTTQPSNLQMELKVGFISVLSPTITFSYGHKIFDRFYYSTCFRTSYGSVHTDDIWLNAAGHSDRIINRYHILDFQLSPEFSYFFTNRFGLYLNLNGIDLATDPKLKNPELNINFSPTYWKIGAKFLLN